MHMQHSLCGFDMTSACDHPSVPVAEPAEKCMTFKCDPAQQVLHSSPTLPYQRPAARAAASVTRTSSSARLRCDRLGMSTPPGVRPASTQKVSAVSAVTSTYSCVVIGCSGCVNHSTSGCKLRADVALCINCVVNS